MSTHIHALYTGALAADRAFHRALVNQYGKAGAMEMRYRTNEQTLEIQELGKLKEAADKQWLAFYRQNYNTSVAGGAVP
jgi:hypothetical protein